MLATGDISGGTDEPPRTTWEAGDHAVGGQIILGYVAGVRTAV